MCAQLRQQGRKYLPPPLPPQVDTKNNVLRPKVGENERALVTAGGPLFFLACLASESFMVKAASLCRIVSFHTYGIHTKL